MIRALVALLALLILSGCASTDPDEGFADNVRAISPSLSDAATEDLVGAAEIVCDLFDKGATPVEIINLFLESGFTLDEATTILAGGISYKCPEYESQLLHS